MKKLVTYIDPPSGHIYGFPKPENMRLWLLSHGYQEQDINFALAHCRMWQEEE